MLFPPHLSADDKYKRFIYIGVLASAHPVETFAGWAMTGLAGIVALIITHLDVLRAATSAPAIRWGLGLLVFAMLLGAIVKHIGILIRTGLAITGSAYEHLYSPEGQSALRGITIPPDQLPKEVAKPFLWPFRQLLVKSAQKGMQDALAAEKRFIKLLCIQGYLFYAMCISAAVALVVLSVAIR